MRVFALARHGFVCCAASWGCAALLGCTTAPQASGQSVQPVPKQQATLEGGFRTRILPAAQGLTLTALVRPARAPPARFRVIVVPGSGCAGMAPLAERYFAGLLHAEVLVLHKPWVSPFSVADAADCPSAFVQADALGSWAAHARAALQADAAAHAHEPPIPQWLVGISEGAELLPMLAPEVPQLAGLVLIGSSGLDPVQALQFQAHRLGADADWRALDRAQAGGDADSGVRQGRSLRYWRDLWRWPLEQPLLKTSWPLLQVWGGADALVPQEAYQRFANQAQGRGAPYCNWTIAGADHGLQDADHDGVQRVWSWLEQWGRTSELPKCPGR